MINHDDFLHAGDEPTDSSGRPVAEQSVRSLPRTHMYPEMNQRIKEGLAASSLCRQDVLRLDERWWSSPPAASDGSKPLTPDDRHPGSLRGPDDARARRCAPRREHPGRCAAVNASLFCSSTGSASVSMATGIAGTQSNRAGVARGSCRRASHLPNRATLRSTSPACCMAVEWS